MATAAAPPAVVAVTRGTSVLSELWGLPRYPGAAMRRRRPQQQEGDEEEEEWDYASVEEEPSSSRSVEMPQAVWMDWRRM